MEGTSVVMLKESEEDQLVMDLPPGFRFHPTDEEIISQYLIPKVINSSFSAVAVGEVDLNKCEPWDLPKKAKMGEKEWYFYCNRDRKYPTGTRTNRATECGYWKATGKDKEIYNMGKSRCLIGMKKTLVFYKGRAPKGEKSDWVMHEYRLEGEFSYYKFPSKDEWVVSRIFHKNSGIKRNPFILPSRIHPCENNIHVLEYCSNTSPLPSLVDNPTSSSLIHEDETIDKKTKFSFDGDDYLSYLSLNFDDGQLQTHDTHHLTPQNHNNQIGSTNPDYPVSFYPQCQLNNPIETFANEAVPKAWNIVGKSSNADKNCKMEQLSSNQSMGSVSHDASSRPSDGTYELLDIKDHKFDDPNNVLDEFDCLWDY